MLDFADVSSLDKILIDFDENGMSSKDGNWSIVRGGYDLDFEICHNNVPVITACDKKLENIPRVSLYDEVIELVRAYYPEYKDDEEVEATISFKIKVKKSGVGELSRIVDHHLDYLLSFDEYPEITSYYDARLELD